MPKGNDKIKIEIDVIDKLTPHLKKLDTTLNKLISTINKFHTATSNVSAVDKSTKAVKNYKKEAISTINEISKYYKKAEKLGGLKFLSPAELGRLGGLKRKLNILKGKLPAGEKQSVELAEFEKVEQAKQKIKDLSVKKQIASERQLEQEKEKSIKRDRAFVRFKQALDSNSFNLEKRYNTERIRMLQESHKLMQKQATDSAKAQWRAIQIKDNFFKKEKAFVQFKQGLYSRSFNYEKQFNVGRIKLIENSNKQIMKDADSFVGELSNIYRKAHKLGGFLFLSKDELDRINLLKSQLQKLKSVAPLDTQKVIDTKLSKLDFLKLDVIKKQLQSFDKEVSSTADNVYKNIEKRNKQLEQEKEKAIKKDKAFVQFKQALDAKSFNLEKKYNTQRIQWILNSNRLMHKQAIDSAKAVRWQYMIKENTIKKDIALSKYRFDLQKRHYKEELSFLQREINAILQVARAKGKLTVPQKLKARALIGRYGEVGKQATGFGLLKPEELTTKIRRFNAVLDNTADRVGTLNSLFHEWWIRFGAVALGFTVIYRAFNYFEQGIGAIVEKVKEGIVAFDDLQENISKLALFYRIYSGDKSFANSMKYATDAVEGLKYAMVTALSPLNDITQGLDELAQHGVFLSASMMKDFVNFTDFIGMIAKTTGSQANQIRQELQSLFEGTKKAGNTLIRFISNAFGEEAVRKIQNSNTAYEQYVKIMKLISKEVDKFKKPILDKSFTKSLTVANNIFRLLVVDAEELAGKLRYGARDANVFAKAVNKVSESLGLNLYQKINDLKVQLKHQKKLLQEGKETPENIEKTRKELEALQSAFASTPASKMIPQLADLMNKLAGAVEWLGNSIPKLVAGVSNLVNLLTALYQRTKPVADSVFDIIKWMIILKATMFGFRFVMLEPFKLILSMTKNVSTSIMDMYSLLSGSYAFKAFTHNSNKAMKGVLGTAKSTAKAITKPFLRATSAISYALLGVAVNTMPRFTELVFDSFSVLNKKLIKLNIGSTISKIFIPKSLIGLIARLSVVALAIWTVIYSILHPKKAKNLGMSLFLAIAEGVLDIQSWVMDKIGSAFDKVINFFVDKVKWLGRQIIKLSKTKGVKHLLPDWLLNWAKDIQNYKFEGGKQFSEKYKKAVEGLKKRIQEERKKVGSFKTNFDIAIETTFTDAKGLFKNLGLGKKANKIKSYIYEQLGLSKEGEPISIEVPTEVNPKINVKKNYVKELDDLFNEIKNKTQQIELAGKTVFGKSQLEVDKQKLKFIKIRLAKISEILYMNDKVNLSEEERLKYETEYLSNLKQAKDIQSEILKLEGKSVDNTLLKMNILTDTLSKLSDIDFLSKNNISLDTYKETTEQILANLEKLKAEYSQRIKVAPPEEKGDLQDKYAEILNTIDSVKEKKKELDILLSDKTSLEVWAETNKAKFSDINMKVEESKTKIKAMNELVAGSLKKTSDLLYDALTGKLKTFEDFVFQLRDFVMKAIYDMVSAIIQAKIQAGIVKMMGNSSTAPSTNITTNNGYIFDVPKKAFAEGGVVNRPTSALIGEAGYPEAVIPMKTGNVPVELKGASQSQPVVVNMNVNAVDAQSFAKYKNQIIDMVNDGIRKGQLTKSIRRTI